MYLLLQQQRNKGLPEFTESTHLVYPEAETSKREKHAAAFVNQFGLPRGREEKGLPESTHLVYCSAWGGQ